MALQLNMEAEIERLKQELKNNMQKYNSVCSEAESGRWKVSDRRSLSCVLFSFLFYMISDKLAVFLHLLVAESNQ